MKGGMNHLRGYKLAFWFMVIAVLCLLGIYWVAFKSGWAWYWQLLAYFLLVPTVWSFIKFARADLELALTEWSAREPPSSERHD
jgi:hypothetical protein